MAWVENEGMFHPSEESESELSAIKPPGLSETVAGGKEKSGKERLERKGGE